MSEPLAAGRPQKLETRRRTKRLLALLSEGLTLTDAAKEAHVSSDRLIRLMDEREFRTVVTAILDGRATAVAVAA